jgi:hypothetical protein
VTTARTYTREFLTRPKFKQYVVSTDGIVIAAYGDDVLFPVPPHEQVGRPVCDVLEPEAAYSQVPDNW